MTIQEVTRTTSLGHSRQGSMNAASLHSVARLLLRQGSSLKIRAASAALEAEPQPGALKNLKP
jgi:hypothetical protein